MSTPLNLSYRDAGVDIDAGNQLVEDIKPLIAATQRPEVIGGLGGFGGLFALPSGYEQPVLVSGTDGIGTKLRLGIDSDRLDGLGIDLVAMCVNDVLVSGAEPLFFLDYFATGKLDRAVAARIIAGVARGCQQAGCALVGGETAEMPGLYHGSDFDAAGFTVGIVERSKILSGESISAGDQILGLASSGPHSNGYSLIRRILEASNTEHSQLIPGDERPLIEQLMAPTRIYVKPVLELLKEVPVKGLCHITGGGLSENLPRILPEGLDARIDSSAWPRPAVFQWLQDTGGVAADEMWRTFNCGIGMTVIVPAASAAAAKQCLEKQGETVWTIGEVTAGNGHVEIL
nr:phosphoribosylformylglycinamidine cyclo-ligase [Oceanococcus sp. HetDA_MAG_MS8]